MHLTACHGGKPVEPDDYMPFIRLPKPAAKAWDDEQVIAAFSGLAQAMGRKVVITPPA